MKKDNLKYVWWAIFVTFVCSAIYFNQGDSDSSDMTIDVIPIELPSAPSIKVEPIEIPVETPVEIPIELPKDDSDEILDDIEEDMVD